MANEVERVAEVVTQAGEQAAEVAQAEVAAVVASAEAAVANAEARAEAAEEVRDLVADAAVRDALHDDIDDLEGEFETWRNAADLRMSQLESQQATMAQTLAELLTKTAAPLVITQSTLQPSPDNPDPMPEVTAALVTPESAVDAAVPVVPAPKARRWI